MDDPQHPSAAAAAARSRVDTLQSLFFSQQRVLVIVALVLALLVPVTSVDADADSDRSRPEDRGILGSLGYFFDHDADAFGSRESHPNGLDAGMATTRIGLVLLLLAGLAAIIVVLAAAAGRERGIRPALITLGVALPAAAGVTALGLTWLPDDEIVTGSTGMLWIAVAAGAGLLYHVWSLSRFD